MNYWNEETINKIRQGYYSAVYFNRAKQILEQEQNFTSVTMQVFQKNEDSILCGMKMVTELLKQASGYFAGDKWVSKWENLSVSALADGERISAWEPVMHITGPYLYFAHLESLYLGILARATIVATNTKNTVFAAGKKPVLFFADRFDYFLNQELDGYAAKMGGAAGVCTQAHTSWTASVAGGTIPHALIAVYHGDTILATKKFSQDIKGVNVVALVDFENDTVKTALSVARAMNGTLWAIRIDTAENIIDKSLQNTKINAQNTKVSGVNPTLVKTVRKVLDQNGFDRIKIIVSGGFNAEKIKWFEAEKTPVDIYGVGSALVHGWNDYTADVVSVDGKPMAKAGREFKENPRLKKIK